MTFSEKLQKSDLNFIAYTFGACAAVYLASFLGFLFPALNWALFLSLLALALFFAVRRPELALLMAFFELLLGSKGYLFSLELFGTEISIRMGLFLIIISVWMVKWIFGERDKLGVGRYLPLMFMIMVAVARGLYRGNNFDNVFYDANGLFFLGYLGPAMAAVKNEKINKMILLLAAGSAMLWTITMFLAVGFSFRVFDLGTIIYKWVRDTGLGEITVVNETFARVFLQSHVFALGTFLIFSGLAMGTKEKTKNIFYLSFSVLSAGILIVDLSRSYWVGAGAGIAAFFWIYARNKTYPAAHLQERKVGGMAASSRQKLLLPLLAIITALVISTLLLPSLPSVLLGRGGSVSDPAASSRSAMLRPLLSGIKKAPILGSGFGTVLTYKTQDPRALQRDPSGNMTTFAFEWGWLDLALKMGLLGVLAYLWLIFCVLKRLYKAAEENSPPHLVASTNNQEIAPGSVRCGGKPLAYGLFATIVALAATHTFSPYLNHPLGIGLLLFADAIAENT